MSWSKFLNGLLETFTIGLVFARWSKQGAATLCFDQSYTSVVSQKWVLLPLVLIVTQKWALLWTLTAKNWILEQHWPYFCVPLCLTILSQCKYLYFHWIPSVYISTVFFISIWGGNVNLNLSVRFFSLTLEHTWVTGFSLFEYFTCL